ncbi:MAG: SDR family NAD(P)-dependent oxidoreductase [Planctomycetaceae bacterium]|jgi:NAD(P)-dependent dehydrogenase (short-subunit alcohol dehydrogenase family)|nr:SDR family oxidoreductase [bacterium]MDC0273356.1 SDR family oxidoreductase [Planctomycetaceae bacterium]MDC0307696.1 SDR family oxidoreductase [Planctomycetaceae bacterium]MDG2389276.1 SDR family NAD(P)-dependent oxidoreductase [Planctomycetaceae bacterium]
MTVKRFSGKTSIITGGESGIGRSTAVLMAEEGANVYLTDIRQLPENASRYLELGISRSTGDVREEAVLQQLVDRAVVETGRLDLFVNNAGVGMVKPVTEVTEEDWDFCMGVNLKGAFFGCKHAIKQMLKGDGGSIVNVASNAGLLPRAHDPLYSTSKQAVVGMTKSLALCHAKDRIRINAVCPGPVGSTGMMDADIEKADDSDQFIRNVIHASPGAAAWNRMITPEEVAESIAWLCSDAALMVTGTMLAIDGGKSLGVPPAS